MGNNTYLVLLVVAYASLLISLITAAFAITGRYHRLYWVAAAGIYVFSIIAGFSIGQITVSITFVFLALAIGYSLGKIKGKLHYFMFAGLGFLIGIFMISFIGAKYIFFPTIFFN